jgi:hypothetical protein
VTEDVDQRIAELSVKLVYAKSEYDIAIIEQKLTILRSLKAE